MRLTNSLIIAQYAMEENHSPAVAAFHAMSHFLDPRITELLVDTALHAGHRSGRWYAAVCGLGRINDPQGFDYFVALLRKDETVLSDEVAYERSHPRTDCTSQIRRAAATALGEMADPKSITPLHEALATGDPVAKACAAYALSLKGDYSGINLLLEEWEQTEKFQVSGGFLFLQFVKLFGKLGEARSIPILIDAFEHKDANEFGEIRRQAKESLKSITGQRTSVKSKALASVVERAAFNLTSLPWMVTELIPAGKTDNVQAFFHPQGSRPYRSGKRCSRGLLLVGV